MTSKQDKLLKFIRNKIIHTGHSPTYREMRDYMEAKYNQTIQDFLALLSREGYIELQKGEFRGISVTPKGMNYDNPLVIGEKIDSQLPSTAPMLSNFSSVFIFSNVNGITVQNTGVIPWTKGGEKSGTT